VNHVEYHSQDYDRKDVDGRDHKEWKFTVKRSMCTSEYYGQEGRGEPVMCEHDKISQNERQK